jgi:acetyl esterase/lipase
MAKRHSGGLCVLSGIECLCAGLPQPAGSVLISPWMDMSMRSHEGGNALVETDYIITANKVCPIYVAKWLNGAPGTSKDVNPLFRQPAEVQGLNPQLILVGAGEFALQESKDLAKLCDEAMVQNELVCEWGQLHIYAMGSTWVDPTVRKRTDGKIIRWMKRCIAQAHGIPNVIGEVKCAQVSLIEVFIH